MTSARPSVWPRWLTFFGLAAGGAALDLWSKQAVFAWRGNPGQLPPWWVVENLVGVETAVNVGALFGMGAGYGNLFAIFSVVAAVGIFVWLWRYRAIELWWLVVALGFVLGGIIGNLYDRLGMWYEPGMPNEWRSAVRDWILLTYKGHVWPNFNIADSLLVTGAIMLAIHSFRSTDDNKKSASQPETAAAESDS